MTRLTGCIRGDMVTWQTARYRPLMATLTLPFDAIMAITRTTPATTVGTVTIRTVLGRRQVVTWLRCCRNLSALAVTGITLARRTLEHTTDVTGLTGKMTMSTDQGKTCFHMVKLDLGDGILGKQW